MCLECAREVPILIILLEGKILDDISKEQSQQIERVFQETMLKRFVAGLRSLFLAVGDKKTRPAKNACLTFGVGLVRDDKIEALFCGEGVSVDSKKALLDMLDMKLRGVLPPEYDGLAYEWRKYQSILTPLGGIQVKLPKLLRGMAIHGKVYRVFLLAESLAGWHHKGLKELGGHLIDSKFWDVQEVFIIQEEIMAKQLRSKNP